MHDWKSLNPFYEQTVQLYQQQFGFLVAVILLMVALSVGNAINMNVHERAGVRHHDGVWRPAGGGLPAYNRRKRTAGSVGRIAGRGGGECARRDHLRDRHSHAAPPNSDLGYISLIRLSVPVTLLSGLIGAGAGGGRPPAGIGPPGRISPQPCGRRSEPVVVAYRSLRRYSW